MTVYVGETFTINPVSKSGLSTSKAMAGSAKVSDESAFSVVSTYKKVRLAGTSTNGFYGGYYTYEVTALKTGTYTITGGATICTKVGWSVAVGGSTNYWAETTKYNSFTCTVKVIPVPVVTKIVIPSTYTTTIGSKYTFSPQIIEEGASTTLKWNSSNTSVATINSSGVMTATNIGTTVITCTASNGVSAECVVTVNPILVADVQLNYTQVELMKGETIQFSASLTPDNATDKGIKWSSSNIEIATIDNKGLLTAIAPGKCSITATATDDSNASASCEINVLSNVLYLKDAISVPSGTLVLPIHLRNTSDITGFQFELQLPEGVAISQNSDGEYISSLSGRVKDHSIMCSKLSNGNYQIIVFSASSSTLSGNDDSVIYLSLNIDENMDIGDYTICMKEIELTAANSDAIHHKDRSAKLTLTAATPGDTNGDGKITVTDAVSIVNHILERTPSAFITKAADVNNDNLISITDAVSIINQILNK